MKILSHRGYWKVPEEKNTPAAFGRSFRLGFGTETDIRDLAGSLVVSHDPPNHSALGFLELLTLPDAPAPEHTLALNIKADGLAYKVAQTMKGRGLDWFVFDMSIPDTRHHLNAGNPVFVRASEVETSPPWLDQAAGVWLDAFEGIWYDASYIASHLDSGRRVCVVSPELHGRPHVPLWKMLSGSLQDRDGLLICTDYPEDAMTFFQNRREATQND